MRADLSCGGKLSWPLAARWRVALRMTASIAGRHQQGSLLLEFMVVAAIALVLSIWATHEWVQRSRALQAQALAVWMETARVAADGYLQRYQHSLKQADVEAVMASEGFANWQAPSVPELQAAGLLPAHWQSAGPLRQQLVWQASRTGSCPLAPCTLQALVVAQPALQDKHGQVDRSLVAEWLLAARGRGLVVWPHAGDWLSGSGVRVPVPVGAGWQPGTVALLSAQAGSAVAETPPDIDSPVNTDDFLRVRDERDPDFQGDVTVQGRVRSNTTLQAAQGLRLDQGWIRYGGCGTENLIGRNGMYPGLLICLQGQWQPLARPAGGGYLFNSRRGCVSQTGASTVNPNTGACNCGIGYQPVLVAETGSVMAPEGLSQGVVCHPG